MSAREGKEVTHNLGGNISEMGSFLNYISDVQIQIVLSVVKDCESEIQMSSTGDFPMSQVNGLQCCLSEGKDRSSSNHILGGGRKLNSTEPEMDLRFPQISMR